MRISEFMHGINNPELTKRLNEHVPKTMEEMMIATAAFIRGEATAASKKKGHGSWKSHDQPKKHADKRPDFRANKFQPPPPMVTPVEKRNSNKFCDFNNDKGHNTDKCMQLKKQIEELVRAGKLSHLIKEMKQEREQPKTGRKEVAAKDKPTTIYMVRSWQRTVKQKITQSFEQGKEITFPPLTTNNGTEGPLIIEAEMGGHTIHRMYIDGGSSMEILYEHCFNRLRPEIKSQMVPATTSLTGFSGETTWPLGQLNLLVTIGDTTYSTKAWMNFMAVKSLSPYNGIIGRPRLKAIQAVPFTVHGMLKFPTKGGIVTIRSSLLIPVECASIGTSSPIPKEKKTRLANLTVPLHPNFPDQEVVMGGSLSDKGRTELSEHRLNIREGCPPVRQKKRGQAPERTKAIQEEVQKLVEARIMREVYYHDWLSNPVMVKKHDGSWRMCVDFTDLNKACPQDCYPLPEIDWKMPFGLKNAGATYQRLMGKAFESQMGRNIEVYVDDLVVKSHFEAEMIRDIEETFQTLRKINMKLNPKKCSFGLAEGVFLGYVITPEGIKPCQDKTTAVLQLPSPQTIKECGPDDRMGDGPDASLLYKPCIIGSGTKLLTDGKTGFITGLCNKKTSKIFSGTSYHDGSSCIDGSGVGLILTNPDGVEFTYALRFQFAASNNEAEYEALIAGLRIATQMGVKNIQANVDSKLVANQVLGTYVAKEDNMIKYLDITKGLVLVEVLETKSILGKEVTAVIEEEGPTWMTELVNYLKEGIFPGDEKEARKLRLKARHMHAGPRSVVAKAIRLGYFWPTMHKDAQDMIRKCSDCQIHRPVTRHPQQSLTPITAPWPFYKWGIDIADPFSEGQRKVKFLIVAIDYFTKWIEAKAVATITGGQHFASVKHSQSNGLVERANRSLREVIPAEIGMPTYRTTAVDVVNNDKELRLNLDLLEERRELAAMSEARSKSKMTKYYNSRVRGVAFKPGDFVYRNNDASHAVASGKLGPKWEGPYEVTDALGNGAYKLRSTDGTMLTRTWNVTNLKRCYL
nr:reverse transcriptase domain-containing protein [Tanacetum cinerariifolium]